MLGLCTIKTMKFILVICALFAAASAENWTGEGFTRCYGDLNI
eukprot:04392.XXX_11554_11372_1 [CDS] Oithona nana genome sequencing.